ncbi:MAG: hypothetical protein ACYDCY_08700 [Metallibacterium sp.]
MSTTLLILTNSVDGTCDVLVQIAAESGLQVFRWNVDLWQRYETCFDGQHFWISDPVGRTIDAAATDVFLLWRKPFTDLMRFEELSIETVDCEQAKAQMGQWIQAVVALMMSEGRVRLVEPYADRRLPKLFQLRLAKHYFVVPRSHFSITEQPAGFGPAMVAKPLGNPSVGEQSIFYTRIVSCEELCRPYPWFLQEALVQGRDITCVYIFGRSYFFECEFFRSEDAIDWRVEINSEYQSRWRPMRNNLIPEWEAAVKGYMHLARLHYGRLDFILQGDALNFLECNSNGQFGWLDDMSSLVLHREFLSAALDPASAVL